MDQLDRGYVHASIGLSMELAVYYQPAGGLTIVARIGGVVLDKTSQSSFCCFSKRGELVVRAKHAREQLIGQLQHGAVHLLRDEFLILRVLEVVINGRAVFFTFDHIRLYCMREAGCLSLKVRVKPRHSDIDEIVRKSVESIGLRQEIRARDGRNHRQGADESSPILGEQAYISGPMSV